MLSLVTQLEEVIRRGTTNAIWDHRLLELYERIELLMTNYPDWHLMTPERQAYLFLLATIGVEEVDDDCLS